MYIVPVNRLADLECLRADIDRLSGDMPMRSAAWLASWWEAYGEAVGGVSSTLEMCGLAVYDASEHAHMIGFVPFCRYVSRQQGSTLRWLGSGEVYSDYMTLLSEPGREEQVVEQVAHWLLDERGHTWDLIELDGVCASDRATRLLVERLHGAGHGVYSRLDAACWEIELPSDWDAFLARLSHSHRKQVRRAVRNQFDSGETRFHVAENEAQLKIGFEIFRRLHVERRRAVEQTTCFDSPRFARFFEQVAPRLFAEGRLKPCWLTRQGTPIAADFNLFGNGTLYAYQGGFDPHVAGMQPGWLLTLATLRHAIQQGWRGFDFLRGDEPYKAHWRAEARPMVHYRIVARETRRTFRHGLWLAGVCAKSIAAGGRFASWQLLNDGDGRIATASRPTTISRELPRSCE